MTDKANKGAVSLRPSEFATEPQLLDIHDKKALKAISELSLSEVSVGYVAPPNDDGYFSFRSPPVAWSVAADLFSPPHLFLHAFCMASHDRLLRNYYTARNELLDISRDKGTGRVVCRMLSKELLNRPVFRITRLSPDKGTFVQVNGWSKAILYKFRGLARKDYGITATTLWLVFSSKSMLTTGQPVQQLDDLHENLVAEWDEWLKRELVDFSEILATLRHYDTITNVVKGT